MALRVDVSGVGVCRTAQPHAVFIISVQQERYEPWNVYRKFQSFGLLRDQLISHNPAIQALPGFDVNNFNHEYLESARVFLDRWLQSLTSNTYILRMQSMYQFLCLDANMPPPYLEIFPRHGGGDANEDIEMDEMFDGDEDWDENHDDHDDDHMDDDGPNSVFANVEGHIDKANRKNATRSPGLSSSLGRNMKKSIEMQCEDDDDAREIQSLSVVEAEFIYDKKDDDKPKADDESVPKRTINLEAFKIIKVIGKGSFGKVFLVRDKASGILYAMKVLKKDYIIRKNQVEHTKTERSVLGYARHPFIVGLNMAFQTADKLFFVLDYCGGGELFFHLGKVGRFPEERARFYAAQIVLALEYVHKLGVIYRDLKPENVLLDQYGNVRLTDFGLSKEGVSDHSTGANSFCGTPEYIAPEVLLRQGHGRAVDWWSLGALLYEMITGLPPFYSRNRETMFEKIMKAELTFPPTVSETAKDLLSHLLVRNPQHRLGSGEADAQELKAHPFFFGLAWEDLESGKLPPPWVPTVSGSLDTSQFDTEFTSMMPIVSPDVRDAYFGSLDRAFEGFTYVDESAAQYITNRGSNGAQTNRNKMSAGAATAATMLASKKS